MNTTTVASNDSVPALISYYKRKAESIFNDLQRLEVLWPVSVLSSVDSVQIKLNLEQLNKIEAAFNHINESLERLDYDEIGNELSRRFVNVFVEVNFRLKRQLSIFESLPLSSTCHHIDTAAADRSAPVYVERYHRPRLPELKLPTFVGGYTEYANFISMFNSIIDKDTELSDIEKLQHLRSCLSGLALDSVRSLEISGANYRAALDILNKRFNNKRLVFQSHIKEIIGLKKVDSTSAGKLREFSDKVNSHVRALETLGSAQEIAGCMVIHMLLQKLDITTQTCWEEAAPMDKIPSTQEFYAFLENRCQRLENLEHAMAYHSSLGKPNQNASTSRRAFVASQSNKSPCAFCNCFGHGIYACSRFGNLSPYLRQREVKKLALCFNCLKIGHHSRECSSGHCHICGNRHHTLLHFDDNISQQPTDALAESALVASSSSIVPSAVASRATQDVSTDVVLLATAIILVKGRSGQFLPCRALLDSGSQLHLVTSRLAQQLQLKTTRSATIVSGLGDTNVRTEGRTVEICFKSRTSDYAASLTALVSPTITDSQPGVPIDITNWNVPANIRLADPTFYKPQRVDLLIGASIFYDLLCVGQIRLVPGLPLLQKTRLGWVVTGGGQRLSQTSLLIQKSPLEDVSIVDDRLELCRSRPISSTLRHNDLTVNYEKRLVSDAHVIDTNKEDVIAGSGTGDCEVARLIEPEIPKDGVTVAKAIELKSMSRLLKNPEESAKVSTSSANGDQAIGNVVSDFAKSVEREGIISVKASAFSDNRKSTFIDLAIAPAGIVVGEDADLFRLEMIAEREQERKQLESAIVELHATQAAQEQLERTNTELRQRHLDVEQARQLELVQLQSRLAERHASEQQHLQQQIAFQSAELTQLQQQAVEFDWTQKLIENYSESDHESKIKQVELQQCRQNLEASVNTAMHYHYRCVDQSVLVFYEWRAFVCQTAETINSPLLVTISENHGDVDVLTPANFLIGGGPATILEPDLTSLDCNLLDDWQRIFLVQHLKGFRWPEECLTLLQHRARWRSPTQSLPVDDVVLEKDENLPPMSWPRFGVLALIPDGAGVAQMAN